MHPFGRQHVVLSRRSCGARRAVTSTDFKRMEFAFGGKPKTAVMLTHWSVCWASPAYSSQRREWLRHRAAHSMPPAIKSGQYDVGLVVGFDKHDRGAQSQTRRLGLDDWYGETGLMLTFNVRRRLTLHAHHDVSRRPDPGREHSAMTP